MVVVGRRSEVVGGRLRKSTDEVRTLLFLLAPNGLGGLGDNSDFFRSPKSADSGAAGGALEDCVSKNMKPYKMKSNCGKSHTNESKPWQSPCKLKSNCCTSNIK